MIVRVKSLKSKDRQWTDYKGVRYKKAKHTIGAYYDKYGSMVTGLSEEDAERLGKIMDKDLKSTSPFWYDFQVIMTDKDLILNTDKPEDELKYLVLKGHFKVKKNKQDLNPYAEYEIFDELEEAKTTNVSFETKTKAHILLSGLSMDEKRAILKLYPGYSKTSSVKDEIINSNLYKQMESDPVKFIELVEDKNREMKIFLKDLVQADILRKNKSAYKYGTDFLGHNEEATIDFLNDPENQSLKIALKKELENKSK